MKVSFELLALFRQKVGAGRLELEVPAGAQAEVPFGAAQCKGVRPEMPTVLAALRAAEARLGAKALLDEGKLREGVLVFLKDAGGATHRVFHPSEERIQRGQAVILSTGMGGG
jgi:hypothetical protein